MDVGGLALVEVAGPGGDDLGGAREEHGVAGGGVFFGDDAGVDDPGILVDGAGEGYAEFDDVGGVRGDLLDVPHVGHAGKKTVGTGGGFEAEEYGGVAGVVGFDHEHGGIGGFKTVGDALDFRCGAGGFDGAGPEVVTVLFGFGADEALAEVVVGGELESHVGDRAERDGDEEEMHGFHGRLRLCL